MRRGAPALVLEVGPWAACLTARLFRTHSWYVRRVSDGRATSCSVSVGRLLITAGWGR